MDEDTTHISVVICTWNRAALLDQTLAHMRALDVPPGITWELIIVNNNCTDETDRVIASYDVTLPIRRLFESRPGLSNARNRAVGAVRGELVVWTDDDVIVDPQWLKQYWTAFKTWPGASFFGGTVDPLYERTPPAWIGRHAELFAGPFAIRQFGADVRRLRERESPFGASMAFPRSVFTRAAFDPGLGRIGNVLLSGEESAFIDSLRRASGWGVWVGTARVQHWIPKERTTRQYIWRWFVADGRSNVRAERLIASGDVSRWLGLPRWAVRRYVQSAAGSLFGLLATGSRRVRWWRDWAFATGVLAESWRRRRITGSTTLATLQEATAH